MILRILYTLKSSKDSVAVGLDLGETLGMIVDLRAHGLDRFVRFLGYVAQPIQFIEHLLLVPRVGLRLSENAYGDRGEGDDHGKQAEQLSPSKCPHLNRNHPLFSIFLNAISSL